MRKNGSVDACLKCAAISYILQILPKFTWFMATICVDVGTSVIKTVAFDDRGTEIALARQETEVLRPAPGFSEQDMYSVWDAAASTVRTVVNQLPDPVRLISLTARGGRLLAAGCRRSPYRPRHPVE
jgi:erythritol kinase